MKLPELATTETARSKKRGTPITPEKHPALVACLRAGLLCNDAILIRENGSTRVEGDPTEAALIVGAEGRRL